MARSRPTERGTSTSGKIVTTASDAGYEDDGEGEEVKAPATAAMGEEGGAGVKAPGPPGANTLSLRNICSWRTSLPCHSP